MADKKRHNFEQLIYNKDLKKVPLVFRFLEVKKTDEIGQLQTKSLNNYLDSVPMSNILIEDSDCNERVK